MTQLIDDGIQASIFTAAHTPAEVRGGLKAAGATGGGGVLFPNQSPGERV